MQQYVVHAWDGHDSEALERRLQVRPRHLAEVSDLKGRGQYVVGGAMLDDEGRMVGSTMIVQFESPDDLQAWLDREPYIQEEVWAKWEIHPFRVAQISCGE